MFNRQKALVELVRLAGGSIDRMVLTKWAFIIRHESESEGGGSFYDFVPYQYGPFSFGLYQEADKLVAHGYLSESGKHRWCLGDVPAPPPTDRAVQQDLRVVAMRFRTSSQEQLLNYVYDSYPYFTINSKRKRLARRTVAPLGVYTAGYEGKSVDAFLNLLVKTGIQHMIDVRRNPIARRYGFHRSTLARLCERLGIRYSHMPSLGISSQARQGVETAHDYQALFADYEATTLQQEQESIQTVATWVRESPSVLVCMEAEAHSCHRSHLAKSVSNETGLPIIHLE